MSQRMSVEYQGLEMGGGDGRDIDVTWVGILAARHDHNNHWEPRVEVAAARSLLQAQDGDPCALAARLRDGSATVEERKLAADLLLAAKRDPHRPPSVQLQIRRELVKLCLDAADTAVARWSTKKFIKFARDRYGIRRADAYEILRETRKARADSR